MNPELTIDFAYVSNASVINSIVLMKAKLAFHLHGSVSGASVDLIPFQSLVFEHDRSQLAIRGTADAPIGSAER